MAAELVEMAARWAALMLSRLGCVKGLGRSRIHAHQQSRLTARRPLPLPPLPCRREDPLRELDFTSVRKMIIGDVGMIQSVYDRCVEWGLINFQAKIKPGMPVLELVADGEGPPWRGGAGRGAVRGWHGCLGALCLLCMKMGL